VTAAVAVAGGGRDSVPRQFPQRTVQARLVALDHQDVVRFLAGDEVVGVVALGLQRVCGDHRAGQVQRVEQRRELGDLVGLAVHGPLREDGPGLLVDGGQQVRGLAIAGAVPGSAQGLAVHGHGAPPGDTSQAGQAARYGGVEIGGADRFQDPAYGRLTRRPEPALQRIEADA
jgi:hypothetical protein